MVSSFDFRGRAQRLCCHYLTAVGYGSSDADLVAEFHARWPAQVHIIGKDILRFHCVIWPAMLMAAGLPVPEQVFVHGFLLVKNEETGVGEKMSKSRGNAIAPADIIDLLGVEGYRYYFMVDVVPGSDGAISFSRMKQVYNAEIEAVGYSGGRCMVSCWC